MHFLSDVNIRFVEASGESYNSGTALVNAALYFVEWISMSPIRIQDCRDRIGR